MSFLFLKGGKENFHYSVKLGNTCLGEMAILTDFSDPATQLSDWDVFIPNQFAALIGHLVYFPTIATKHLQWKFHTKSAQLPDYWYSKLNERISSTYSPNTISRSDPWFWGRLRVSFRALWQDSKISSTSTHCSLSIFLKNEIHVVISSWVDNDKIFIKDDRVYRRSSDLRTWRLMITNNDFHR